MSKLYELLQGVIQKVNKSVSTDAQQLTEEQKLQVKTNLGISNTVASTIPDWDQSNETAPDYVKNRTHYKSFSEDYEKRFIDWFDGSLLTITQLEDGSYAWAEENYVIPQSAIVKELTSADFEDDMMWNTEDEFTIKVSVLVNTNLYTYGEKFVVRPDVVEHYDDGSLTEEVVVDTPYFKLTGPYHGQPNWYFVPKVPPTEHTVSAITGGKESLFSVTKPKVTYKTLPVQYLPDDVLFGSEVRDGNILRWEYINNTSRPFYNIPYEETVVGSIDNMLPNTTTNLSFHATNRSKVYRINGKDYEVRLRSYGGEFYIGNEYLLPPDGTTPEDTGEDFVIFTPDGWDNSRITISADAATDANGYVSLGTVLEIQPEVVKTLDAMYIPDSVLTLSETEMSQLENLLNPTTTEE